MKNSRRKKRRRPIPWPVACAMAFIDEGLSMDDFEQEVRKTVRATLLTAHKSTTPALIEHYDERVTAIIEEELARN